VLALNTFVSFCFFNLLPGLASAFARDPDEGRRLAGRSLVTSLWVGGLLAGSVTIAAPLLVDIVYGARFTATAGLLRIAVWMLPLSCVSGYFRYVLIATGHQRSDMANILVGAAVAVTLSLVLLARGPAAPSLAVVCVILAALTNAALGASAVARREPAPWRCGTPRPCRWRSRRSRWCWV
jgi:O-antigen/teichoic acid export membrane protein